MGDNRVPAWFSEPILGCAPGLDASRLSSLFQHYQLLERWNAKMNLTSVRKPVDIVHRHYCESLLFAGRIPDAPSGTRLADVGSGAGFPGIPMAIAHPDWKLTLVESDRRKGVFLREATRDLSNVEVLVARAETIQRKFDYVVARAVRPADVTSLLPQLAERIGLMIGSVDAKALRVIGGIHWGERVIASSDHERVFLFGTYVVPRGT